MSLLTPRLVWLLVFIMAALACFYSLLSVVPLYASETGSTSVGVGMTTGLMMASTVVTELFLPQLISRFGTKPVNVAGVLLIALPGLLLLWVTGLPAILLVCILRGAGLAIVVVIATSIAAVIAAEGRRGEVIGIYGAATAIPAIVGLPLGLWLAEQISFPASFLVATALGLIALIPIRFLPDLPRSSEHGSNALALLRVGPIARLAIVFAASTLALGTVVTFLPLATGELIGIAAIALLVQSCTTTVARWGIGRIGDLYGAQRFLVPSILLMAAGVGVLFFVHSPAAIIAGMAVFGIGLGMSQNLTLTLMLERAHQGDYARISVLWNIAFDGGLGIGSVAFGYLAVVTGYAWGFPAVAALLMLTLIPAVWRGRPAKALA